MRSPGVGEFSPVGRPETGGGDPRPSACEAALVVVGHWATTSEEGWGNRCPAFDAFLKRVLSVSSNISPHLQHPAAAAYTRVMMAHHRAVGSLLSSKLAGVVAHV